MLQHSRLAFGRVWHVRHMPKRHAFSYAQCLIWLDADEWEDAARLPGWSKRWPALARLRREDFFAPERSDVKSAVMEAVLDRHPDLDIRRVMLLGNPGWWGLSFNPVVFHVCLNGDGHPVAILSDVHNTPWNERHAYIHRVTEPETGQCRDRFEKEFHVSPFMPMNLQYDWHFSIRTDHIRIHMRLLNEDKTVFEAIQSLRLEPLTRRNAILAPLRSPLMTARTLAGIYWQALRLKLKGIPFHSHPRTRTPS